MLNYVLLRLEIDEYTINFESTKCFVDLCDVLVGRQTFPYCPRHLSDIHGVEIKPSELILVNGDAGLGLFATKNFESGYEFDQQYEGRYLTRIESNAFINEGYPRQHFFLDRQSRHGDMIIDGSDSLSGYSKYINNQTRRASSNVAMRVDRSFRDLERVVLVAIRPIFEGEELLTIYSEDDPYMELNL